MRDELIWLAAIFDGEGNLGLERHHTKNRKKINCLFYRPRIVITNTNLEIMTKCETILKALGVSSICWHTKPPAHNIKTCYVLSMVGLDAGEKILTALLPFLIGKREFAEALILWTKQRIKTKNFPLTKEEWDEAERIRRVYMPKSKSARAANGEGSKEITPCQAEGSVACTSEGVETRSMSNTNNNSIL